MYKEGKTASLSLSKDLKTGSYALDYFLAGANSSSKRNNNLLQNYTYKRFLF